MMVHAVASNSHCSSTWGARAKYRKQSKDPANSLSTQSSTKSNLVVRKKKPLTLN